MTYTFDCIVLKNNKGIKEQIMLSLEDASEQYKNIYNFLNNSLIWLKSINEEGLKEILLKIPYNTKIYWKDIYPNYSSENIEITELDCAKYIGINLLSEDYLLSKYHNYKITKKQKLTLKFDEIKSLSQLNSNDLKILISITYDILGQLLEQTINQSFEEHAEEYLINKINDLYENIIYIDTRKFRQTDLQKFTSNNIIAQWIRQNYTINWGNNIERIDCIQICIFGKMIITSNNVSDYTIGFKIKQFNEPFIDSKILNEILNNPKELLKILIENQIRELKIVYQAEEQLIKIIENEIIPNLKNEKNLLENITFNLSNNKNDIEEKIEKLNSKISLFRDRNNLNSYMDKAYSIIEKRKRIQLLTDEINFWLNIHKLENELFSPI